MLKIKKYTYSEVLQVLREERGDGHIVYIDYAGSLTVAELQRRIDMLATSLIREYGLEPGGRVAVIGSNTADWFISFYAVIRAGGVAVVENSKLSSEEIRKHFEDYKTDLLILTEPDKVLEEELTDHFGEKVVRPVIENLSSVNKEDIRMLDSIEQELTPGRNALAFFTSGSTSKPKMVLLSQEAMIINACRSEERMCSHGDHFILSLPAAHILGQQCNLRYLLAGGTCILADNKVDTIVEVFRRYPVHTMDNVYTVLLMIMRHADFRTVIRPKLDYIALGGAPVSPEQMKEMEEQFDAVVTMGYGMTETACTVTLNAFDDPEEKRFNTTGRAIDSVEVRIGKLNAKKESETFCAQGDVGEVLVGGDCLMNGYAAGTGTAEEIIDGDGWLHTGDLGYLDEDGYLVICGRKKNIIIKGGENVMPGEIENCINELESVDSAIVLGVPDEKYGEEIAAFVVPKQGSSVSAEDVLDAVGKVHTRFKLPGYIFSYDFFPLNKSGKPDIIKLKEDAEEMIRKAKNVTDPKDLMKDMFYMKVGAAAYFAEKIADRNDAFLERGREIAKKGLALNQDLKNAVDFFQNEENTDAETKK